MGRPWTLMASGSPRRPTVKEAGFRTGMLAGTPVAEVAWSLCVRFRVWVGTCA